MEFGDWVNKLSNTIEDPSLITKKKDYSSLNYEQKKAIKNDILKEAYKSSLKHLNINTVEGMTKVDDLRNFITIICRDIIGFKWAMRWESCYTREDYLKLYSDFKIDIGYSHDNEHSN